MIDRWNRGNLCSNLTSAASLLLFILQWDVSVRHQTETVFLFLLVKWDTVTHKCQQLSCLQHIIHYSEASVLTLKPERLHRPQRGTFAKQEGTRGCLSGSSEPAPLFFLLESNGHHSCDSCLWELLYTLTRNRTVCQGSFKIVGWMEIFLRWSWTQGMERLSSGHFSPLCHRCLYLHESAASSRHNLVEFMSCFYPGEVLQVKWAVLQLLAVLLLKEVGKQPSWHSEGFYWGF